MGSIDFILLSILASALLGSLVFRGSAVLRFLVILTLLGTICFCLFSFTAFSMRLAASAHERAGKPWSPEFREGVHAMAEVERPYYPYILFCSVGLALLAFIPRKRHKFFRMEEPAASRSRDDISQNAPQGSFDNNIPKT
jgi:hypothetical protein